jgi:uncharacterized protein YfkK (UPF0435 family)
MLARLYDAKVVDVAEIDGRFAFQGLMMNTVKMFSPAEVLALADELRRMAQTQEPA